MNRALILSCEHGGNRVPARYRANLDGAARALAGDAGWDPGAAVLTRGLGRGLGTQPIVATATRLLIDPNRCAENPARFSRWTRDLPDIERDRIQERYWRPHREAVESAVRGCGQGGALHVSVHSFAARWKGKLRDVDVGLLYDPARERERAFVDAWLEALAPRRPDLRLRRNLPYRGTSDGLTTTLRGRFAPGRYLGLELEVSQRFPLGEPRAWRRLRADLLASLRAVLES